MQELQTAYGLIKGYGPKPRFLPQNMHSLYSLPFIALVIKFGSYIMIFRFIPDW